MMITGLDLASRLCGWCAGTGDRIPECGAWKLPQADKDLGRMLDVFDEFLGYHIERFHPQAIVYEAPILVVKHGEVGRTDKLLTIRKLYNLGGHVEFVCKRRGIACAEADLKRIKREVTGNRHAEKEAMVAVARKCGLQLPDDGGHEDAADAWGAWLIGLREWAPAWSARWDRAVFSPRGALI